MRVLILSCNTGGGHNSCANALADCFEKNGHLCDIADSLSFVSGSFTKMMSEGHSLMYRRFPKVFTVGYGMAEKHPQYLEKHSSLQRTFSRGSKKLFEFIKNGGYDTVISVHVFSGIILKKVFSDNAALDIKTAFVATDCTCSPGVKSFDYDFYFVPNKSTAEEFSLKGIPAEKIFSVGIPVGENFYESIPKEKAKLAFGINPSKRHLVMMCGSMGCGPVEDIAEKFHEKPFENAEISIVCGNNLKLFKKLYEKYNNDKNIHIMGYVTDVALLFDSADLYLTKPGGLSTAEALAKGLPMVFINAVSGCEEYNMNYFVSIGGAEKAVSAEDAFEKCSLLLGDCEKLSLLSSNLSAHRKTKTAEAICGYLGGDVRCPSPKETIGASL